uniref:Uncharacterized protein n=1 Tax=Kalanchoe fedtschenkoi TaxID=63787 RepID=A0A7N1A935_KALFE
MDINSSVSLSEKLGAHLEEAVATMDKLMWTDIASQKEATAAIKRGLVEEIAQLKAGGHDEEEPELNITKLEWEADTERVRTERLKLEEDMGRFRVFGARVGRQMQWSMGVKSQLIAARELRVASGDAPECWKWTSVPETRYAVAELLDVNMLDISGRINTSRLSPGIQYTAYLVFKLQDDHQGFDSSPPAEAYVGVAGGEQGLTKVSLVPRTDQTGSEVADEYPEERYYDGWTEVVLGEYLVKEDQEVELEIGLKEISGNCNEKKGLVILGIEMKTRW